MIFEGEISSGHRRFVSKDKEVNVVEKGGSWNQLEGRLD